MNIGCSISLKVSKGCTLSFRDFVDVDVDQAFSLVDFVASENFNFDPFWKLWRAYGLYSWKNFAFFFVWDFNDKSRLVIWSYDSGLLPSSWVKVVSIAHGLNFLLFYGSISRLKCVGHDFWFDIADSYSPAMIWRHLIHPTLISAWILLITLSFISTLQLLLLVMCPSRQFAHLDSCGY